MRKIVLIAYGGRILANRRKLFCNYELKTDNIKYNREHKKYEQLMFLCFSKIETIEIVNRKFCKNVRGQIEFSPRVWAVRRCCIQVENGKQYVDALVLSYTYWIGIAACSSRQI